MRNFNTTTVPIALVAILAFAACGEKEPPATQTEGSEAEAALREDSEGRGAAPPPISEEHPYERIPVIDAYYDGAKAWFIHTDVSGSEMAERLTGMVGYRTMHVPALAGISSEHLGDIYVFRNGVERSEAEPWGGGPFHYQIDVLSSVPGDEGYSPLRTPHMVMWNEEATPRILRSVQEIREAEAAGELTVQRTDVVVNAPVVQWPTAHLGGKAEMPGEGTRPEGG